MKKEQVPEPTKEQVQGQSPAGPERLLAIAARLQEQIREVDSGLALWDRARIRLVGVDPHVGLLRFLEIIEESGGVDSQNAIYYIETLAELVAKGRAATDPQLNRALANVLKVLIPNPEDRVVWPHWPPPTKIPAKQDVLKLFGAVQNRMDELVAAVLREWGGADLAEELLVQPAAFRGREIPERMDEALAEAYAKMGLQKQEGRDNEFKSEK